MLIYAVSCEMKESTAYEQCYVCLSEQNKNLSTSLSLSFM